MPAATVIFTPNPAGLVRLLQGPGGATARWVARKTAEVATTATTLAPVKTGNLRSSIQPRVEFGPLRGEVEATAPYSLYVHEGTSPHPITPVNARVLRFPTKAGTIVYAQSVNHPGTRPQPFLSDALAKVVVR
jgi:hypothetical protein